jgi:hypothetical protein
MLRGRDIDTEAFLPRRREEQFVQLQTAQETVLNLSYWHQFFNAISSAGFRSREWISSENTLLYAYAFYLIGKTRYHVPEYQLQRIIGRWFYTTSISGRYTSSPETVMDADLNRIKDLSGSVQFVAALDRIINSTLTSDFWTITVPTNLETSSSQSPSLFAYNAGNQPKGCLTHIVSIPCKKIVSREGENGKTSRTISCLPHHSSTEAVGSARCVSFSGVGVLAVHNG